MILCRHNIENNYCGNKQLNKKVNRTLELHGSIDVTYFHWESNKDFSIIDQ